MLTKSTFLTVNQRTFKHAIAVVIASALISGVIASLDAKQLPDTWAIWKPILYSTAVSTLTFVLHDYLTNSQGQLLTAEPTTTEVTVKTIVTAGTGTLLFDAGAHIIRISGK